MHKILPYNTQSLSYDPMVDISLLILSTDAKIYRVQLCENFIHTIVYDNEYSKNIAFSNSYYAITNDCMMSVKVPHAVAQKTIPNICEYVATLINENFYVSFLADTYFINNYSTFQTEHQEHGLLLYGYDQSEQVFYGQDYFDFLHKSSQLISFSDIENSFKQGQIEPHFGVYEDCNFYLLDGLRLKKNWDRPINLTLIKNSLLQFINDEPCGNHHDCYYGIQFIRIMKERCANGILSIKHFHFIYVHIYFMLFRAETLKHYFAQRGELFRHIIDELKILLEQSTQLENIVIKSVYKKSISEDIVNILSHIHKRYYAVIEEIIELIKE